MASGTTIQVAATTMLSVRKREPRGATRPLSSLTPIQPPTREPGSSPRVAARRAIQSGPISMSCSSRPLRDHPRALNHPEQKRREASLSLRKRTIGTLPLQPHALPMYSQPTFSSPIRMLMRPAVSVTLTCSAVPALKTSKPSQPWCVKVRIADTTSLTCMSDLPWPPSPRMRGLEQDHLLSVATEQLQGEVTADGPAPLAMRTEST